MKNLKLKGKIVTIISIIVMVVAVFLMINVFKDKDTGNLAPSNVELYEVDNSFRVDSPLGFNGPFEVNVYGIIENKSDKDANDVVVKVYYYDVENKRQEVLIPSFDISANSEYTIDYDIVAEKRAFHVDKVEYKIGNGNFQELDNGFFSSFEPDATPIFNVVKLIPCIIILIIGGAGFFVGLAMVTFKKPSANKFSDVFKPSVRKDVVKCKYCGSNNKNGELKCSSCGASIEY